MRISDWSSDVCSSDLPMQPSPHEGQQRQQLPQALRLKAVEVEALIVDRRILGDRHAAAVETAVADGELDRAQGFGTSLMRHARLENMAGPASLECADRVAKDKIGRAACRERVWQYG